jgi:mannose-6-phosphate isomerase-like protein (cupin superfamily)
MRPASSFSILVSVMTFALIQTQPATTLSQDRSEVRPFVVGDKERPAVRDAGCGSLRFLVNASDTNGAFALLEGRECQYVTGLHRHNRTDEAFYVVEGSLNVFIDGRVHRLGPGGYAFIPRGTPHAQGNPTNTPNKVVLTITPAGFEEGLRYRTELLKTMKFGSPEFLTAMTKMRQVQDLEQLGPTPPGMMP